MPQYFFHVLNDIESRDDDGQFFTNLDEAVTEARETAADLIRDEIRAGRQIHPDHRIEIEDEQSRVVHVLRFGDLFARSPGDGRATGKH
jgi:hypothetical protein